MKKILFYFVSFSVLSGCGQNDNDSNGTTEEQDTIFGSWQLIAVYDGSDQNDPWDPPTLSREIIFHESGTFQDSRIEDCEATFSNDEELIEIDYSCRSEITIYTYRFEDGNLILDSSATPGSSCDEGCAELYSRD